MAISTNDRIDKFGTTTQIDDTSTSSISDGAFGEICTWTNSDDVPEASFILKAQWATVTSVANKAINVYARPLNIQSTNDPVAPSASRKSTWVASFNVYAAATTTDYWFDSTRGSLPNMKTGQEYEFYLENQTGQTISAGWALYIVPTTDGPKA